MNLKEIIARKKWDFDQEYFDSNLGFVSMHDRDADDVKDFLEKAIRESVEEALQEVRPLCAKPRIIEKKGYREYNFDDFLMIL